MKKKEILIMTGVVCLIAISLMLKFSSMISSSEGGWSDPKAWVDFGTFMGGTLGPVFAFLGIAYLAWSVKEQGEMFQKQLKEDRRKDECSMLLSEIQHHLANLEELLERPADLSTCVDELLQAIGSQDVKYHFHNNHTIVIDGTPITGSVLSFMEELESTSGVQKVNEFVKKNSGVNFIYPLEKAAVDFKYLVPLFIEANEKKANSTMLKSMITRCEPIAWSLYRWGLLNKSYVACLATLKLLPVDILDWKVGVKSRFVKELEEQEGVEINESEYDFRARLDSQKFMYVELHSEEKNDAWCKAPGGIWQKAS